MKQLAIFVNRDLEARVLAALDHVRVDAFLRVAEATGNRFLDEGEVPRTVAWEAVMFVVPAIDESRAERVAAELAGVAAECDAGPCLRVVALPVEVLA